MAGVQNIKKRVLPLLVLASSILVVATVVSRGVSPRVWLPEEVPVAFWGWDDEMPSEAQLNDVLSATGARILFLRAGQLDVESGNLKRIRSANGVFPGSVELHLVYNATRDLLRNLGGIDPEQLAEAILAAVEDDLDRANQQKTPIAGVQLDIDSPTRLLSRYSQTVEIVRRRLDPAVKLSITGLPTWMESPELSGVLRHTDFWAVQCYGARIPQTVTDIEPVSSPEFVARSIERARKLDHPFYAGLAIYGYTILYDRNGRLVEIRGNLSAACLVRNSSMELVETGSYGGSNSVSEYRQVFRARSESVIDGLAVRTGETLVANIPTSAVLLESAAAVRRLSGPQLLGICLFRMPSIRNETTLGSKGIARALAGKGSEFQINLSLVRNSPVSQKDSSPSLTLTARNTGASTSRPGIDSLVLNVRSPGARLEYGSECGFDLARATCSGSDCSPARADGVRFTSLTWSPGDESRAELRVPTGFGGRLEVEISAMLDDGRQWHEMRVVEVAH